MVQQLNENTRTMHRWQCSVTGAQSLFILRTLLTIRLMAWHSGRTSVFGRWTFPVLRSTCIWRVTSYMGYSYVRYGSANSANSAFHPFGVDKWVVSCNQMSALVTPSGECLRSEGLVWLTGRWCVRWLFTAGQLFVSTCNGRPRLALQHHWLLPINCHFDDSKARPWL